MQYAYGSYGYSTDASFSSSRLSLLNRGFVFAIAHIRGGQEMGRQWYEDGKLMKKKNTFTDFIDCGEFLIKEKYTSKGHLYAQGGSAGGLLMGAITNMAPDLWNGVIAQVPFVDVINTMLDESIPLTTNEFDEWGNPKNKEAYDYMKSYSPYENVEKKNYHRTITVNASPAEAMKKISQVNNWWKHDFSGSAEKLNDRFAVLQIPNARGVVGRSGQNSLPVRTEINAPHMFLVHERLGDRFSRGGVPDTRGVIFTRSGDRPAVRTEARHGDCA